MKLSLLILAIILLSVNISYSVFQYKVQSRQLNVHPHGKNDNEYGLNLREAALNAPQPKGYCTKNNPTFPFNNQKLCGGNYWDIFWIWELKWRLDKPATFEFEIGGDFGLGAAIFVDEGLHQVLRKDLWWAGNFGSHSVIKIKKYFAAGAHTIHLYAGEKCCDGHMNVRYRRDNDTKWKKFTPQNLNCDTNHPYANVRAETKQIVRYALNNDQNFANNLVQQFNQAQQPKGYCTKTNPAYPVSNQKTCGGPATDIFFMYEIKFDLYKNNLWIEIQLGSDFGKGYAVSINDKFYSSSIQDIYWANNWNNHGHIIKIKQDLPKGWHTIKIYGRERCCDGDQRLRFRVTPHGHFHELTVANFKKAVHHANIKIKFSTKKLVIPAYEHVPLNTHNFEYLHGVLPQPKGYCEKQSVSFPTENSKLCPHGSNYNILWKIEIEFYETHKSDYKFQFGADLGLGALVKLNGKSIVNVKDDLWWYHNWNAHSELVKFNIWTQPNQIYVLEIYGGELCCDGLQDIRFSKNGGHYQSINNLNATIKPHKCHFSFFH